jgi:rare lipoprotein A
MAAALSSGLATALSAASTLTRSATHLRFLLAVYLLSASVALLPVSPRVDSFFDPAGISRVVAGVSQARVAAVHTVMGAHAVRSEPRPEHSQWEAMAAGAISGIATWYGGADGYGPEDTMADGSPFNPDDPTIAASNAWPLGARLMVCHGERCIPVCVRDRGSFRHAVDLSRAAFAQLAPLSSGVIDVTVQALP